MSDEEKVVRPSWFKNETGFKFADPDGDIVVVLGDGGFTTEEAYEIAIKKRMEWAKMNRTGAEKWFRDLDWLEKVTNHKILES